MISKAETNLSHFFKNKKVSFQGHSEIIILSRSDLSEVKAKYLEVYNTFGIVNDMIKIMADNDQLITSQKYQETLLKEKDARINELNRELTAYKDRDMEWRRKEVEWTRERSELLKQNTLLLHSIKIK